MKLGKRHHLFLQLPRDRFAGGLLPIFERHSLEHGVSARLFDDAGLGLEDIEPGCRPTPFIDAADQEVHFDDFPSGEFLTGLYLTSETAQPLELILGEFTRAD